MIRPQFQLAIDGLRHSRDKREFHAVFDMADTVEEFRLLREATRPKPRGESPVEIVDALARKAIAHATENEMKLNAAVLETVPMEDHESLFDAVLKRAYHLNHTAKQKRKAKKRPLLKG